MIHRHFAVIGDPISHSLSPLLHQTGFDICYPQNAGISSTPSYTAYHVKKEELAEFMRMFRGEIANKFKSLSFNNVQNFSHNTFPPFSPMSGLSVTLPHKKEIMQYADIVTSEAELAGAANTLYWEEDKLIADNTDIIGFLSPLKALPNIKNALVLGAGGAAAAVLVGLLQLAQKPKSELKEIFVSARREEQAQELIAHIKREQKNLALTQPFSQKEQLLQVLPFSEREKSIDLLVNTIPASLGGQSFSPRTHFENVYIAYDLLYAQTPFIQSAKNAGIVAITGEEMFLEQGAQQFLLWTNMRIPQEAFTSVRNKINLRCIS